MSPPGTNQSKVASALELEKHVHPDHAPDTRTHRVQDTCAHTCSPFRSEAPGPRGRVCLRPERARSAHRARRADGGAPRGSPPAAPVTGEQVPGDRGLRGRAHRLVWSPPARQCTAHGTLGEPLPGSSPLLGTGEFRENLPRGPCVRGWGVAGAAQAWQGPLAPEQGRLVFCFQQRNVLWEQPAGEAAHLRARLSPPPSVGGRQSSSFLHRPPGSRLREGVPGPESRRPEDCRQETGTLGSHPLPRPPPSPVGQLPPGWDPAAHHPSPTTPDHPDQVSSWVWTGPEAVGLQLLPGHPGALISPWKGRESCGLGGGALQPVTRGSER